MSWDTIATVPFDTTQYHDVEISPSTTYVYRVMAMPKSGDHSAGAYSGGATLVVPGDTGSSGEAGSGSHGEAGSK